MTETDLPTVAVVGPGAIGTTVAVALHEGGAAPFVAGRTARTELRLDVGGSVVVAPVPVRTDPDDAPGAVDLVVLAVKATQNPDAAPWLARLCRPGTVVCVLQNGVEQRQAVAPLAPGATVVPAVVWFPAERLPDATVRLLAEPRLTLPDAPGSDVVVRALQGSRCAVGTTSDFASAAWRKLLQNAAAGLMALTGRRSGVFGRDDVGALTLAYLRECLAVARAEGADLGEGEPQRVLDAFRGAPPERGTSILADREAGRPLEWDVRNGVVRRLGRAHGIPTPISDVLVPLLAAASDGPG
ncbi:oxidoreductase [Cellulomonas iranensis]|uniref:2-dehydropantoate 2-reductase n=1 Tax=Cellulomonas iranensis TaxID=76862 RepID=A0ABU0GPM4_9CELL|nr:oxidoreductase [Cellulomonas iranensis]MDQ0427013.1 2-dehydropantoate 2-reductase [Cellulomonas iranensis]